jgi:hypothetical protein
MLKRSHFIVFKIVYRDTSFSFLFFQELLPDLLSGYVEYLRKGALASNVVEEDEENVDFGGSSGTVEDTCVKVGWIWYYEFDLQS